MENKQPVQPIFILPENAQRTAGKDAQRLNIAAAKLLGETIRTTLGPKGMDKMLVDSLNAVTITNDGVTILNEMSIEHPAAKMIVEVAKTQDNEVGDGTTSVVVLAGELLKQAEELLDKNIHPTVISKGYNMAVEASIKFLNSLADEISIKDALSLKKIAVTAMTGKGAELSKNLLANLCVKAVLKVYDNKIDRSNVRIEKRIGGSTEDSELIEGIVLDKEKVHASMPDRIDNANIVILDSALEVKSTEVDAKVSISDPEHFQKFLDMEETMLKGLVDKLVSIDCNVVICQKGIDDMAQHFLAKKGIYACRRVKKSDLEYIARATNANIISNVKEITKEDVGFAGIVEEVKLNEDESMTYIRDCENPKTVSILIRGGSEHAIDEIARAIEDAIGDLAAALSNNKVVSGAASTEVELIKKLSKFGEGLSGREQLAVQAFSKALEVIPRTLAENAGLDPIDIITKLKAEHDTGNQNAGINVITGKVINAKDEGIIEPLKIKTQAISSAGEVASMILRIDDVILNDAGAADPTNKSLEGLN